MHLSCIAGQHAPAPGEVRNQGFGFSHCRRCGRDMVRSNRAWRTVPRGFRVVWSRKPPRRPEVSAAQLFFDLPAAGRALIVPAGTGAGHLAGMLNRLLAGLRHLTWTVRERLRAGPESPMSSQ